MIQYLGISLLLGPTGGKLSYIILLNTLFYESKVVFILSLLIITAMFFLFNWNSVGFMAFGED